MRVAALLAAAACSSPKPATPDGPPPPEIDAALTPISITVYEYATTTPLANAMVDFVAPDGIEQMVTTDANGVASAHSPAGTTVVAYLKGELDIPLVKAFYGAIPGDSIIAGRIESEGAAPLGDIQFALPPSGTNSRHVTVSCGQIPDVALRETVSACPFATDATAVGWAEDTQGQLVGGPSVMMHLDLASLVGTTVTMPAYDPAPITVTGAISNIPADVTSAFWSEAYFVGSDPHAFAYAESMPPASPMTMLGIGDRTISTVYFAPLGFTGIRYTQIDASRITDLAFDATTAIATPDVTPHFDLATQSVTWTESPGREPTLVNAYVDVDFNGMSKAQIELFAAHPSSHAIALPPLPHALQPRIGDTIHVVVRFYLVDGKSYDELLQTFDRTPGFAYLYDPTFTGQIWATDG